MKTVLLTGGCGFIGHHTVEHILKKTDWNIVIMDRLTYAGNLNFLLDMDCWEKEGHRVRYVAHDFRYPISELTAKLIGPVDYIIHMGAESHVDRSIEDPIPFFESNVMGTVNMLEYARRYPVERFIYVSTDEVYGPAHYETIGIDGMKGLHLHKEGEPHKPSNPYSASKSGAEAACYAFWNTYNMPIIITNTMNNFGERQNSEKFVPKTIKRLLNGDSMIAHCKKDGETIVDVSSRCWLHARNHADGLLFVIEHGVPGESYNITGEWASVETMIFKIAEILDVNAKIIYEDFHSFRPGHDMHYGLDGTKLRDMGWVPPFSLDESLRHTVLWAKNNTKWL